MLNLVYPENFQKKLESLKYSLSGMIPKNLLNIIEDPCKTLLPFYFFKLPFL